MYNRSVYSTTDYFPFKIIYGFNPFSSLDLFSFPIDKRVSLEGNRKTHALKALYENVRQQIQKEKRKKEQCVFKANKELKRVNFLCICEKRDFLNKGDLS